MLTKAAAQHTIIQLALCIAVCWGTQFIHDVYPASGCPSNDSCLTLQDIATKKEEYLTSNSTLIFHPGQHTLHDELVVIEDISNLTLQGYCASNASDYQLPRIRCSNSVFSFSVVSELLIDCIHFVSCRSKLINATAVVRNSQFSNSSGDYGGALVVHSGSTAMFKGDTLFMSNAASVKGGAVYANSSVLSFSGTITFMTNGSPRGGALAAYRDSSVTFHGVAKFVRNVAFNSGGAIHAGDGNILTFNGTTIFDNNVAVTDGGALKAFSNNRVIFLGTTTFENSVANGNGGAVYAAASNFLTLNGNITFRSNLAMVGAGVCLIENNDVIFSDSTTFSENRANYGSALYGSVGNGLIFHGRSDFKGNIAGRDGTLYVARSNSLVFNSNTRFENCRANRAGVIYVGQSNICTFNSSCTFHGNLVHQEGGTIYAFTGNTLVFGEISRFEGNTANLGGAVHIEHGNSLTFSDYSTFNNNSAQTGGALSAVGNNSVIFGSMCSFERNSAVAGGALYINSQNSLAFYDRSTFEGNLADHGGAIYAESNNSLAFHGDCSFQSNTAQQRGGAVYTLKSNSLIFHGVSTFKDCTATSKGGALTAVTANHLIFYGRSYFRGNTAGIGGFIFAWEDNEVHFHSRSEFESNTAGNAGGAVYALKRNNFVINGSSLFRQNTANSGGALYANESNYLVFISTNNFRNNTAPNGGAIYVTKSNRLEFIGNSTFESNRGQYGGAVHAVDSNTFTWSGDSTFQDSAATYVGGALCAIASNSFTFNGESCFQNNTAVLGGALYIWETNIVSLQRNCTLESNFADHSGGGLYAFTNNTLLFGGSSTFINNTANQVGGALYVSNSNTMVFREDSQFTDNTALAGGAILAVDSNTVVFHTNSHFEGNEAKSGGAVYANTTNIVSFSGSSRFVNNTADFGGVFNLVKKNSLTFNGSSIFNANEAQNSGGAVYTRVKNDLHFHGSSTFEGNGAVYGGTLYALERTTMLFKGNSLFKNNNATYGGALYTRESNSLTFDGNSHFDANTAEGNGGAVCSLESNSLIFKGCCLFERNTAVSGGGIFIQEGSIAFTGTGTFSDNSATQDGYGGALLAVSSSLAFTGTFVIANNTAGYGGGLTFDGLNDERLLFGSNTSLIFERNFAQKRGGALNVQDSPFTYCFNIPSQMYGSFSEVSCFFQLTPDQCSNRPGISGGSLDPSYFVAFYDNTAVESGDSVYGGLLESCTVDVQKNASQFCLEEGSSLIERTTNLNASSGHEISSDPYRICMCENNTPNCDVEVSYVQVYPGQVHFILVVAVGQMNGTVPSVVRALPENLTVTPTFKVTKPAEKKKECAQLKYPLLSHDRNASLSLYSDEPCSTSGIPHTIQIAFLPCPVGFALSDEGMCDCEERLQRYTDVCLIQNLTISREDDDTFWAGVEGTDTLILHPHCPFDYCTDDAIDFQLTDDGADEQCANHRSGVLCGGCQTGYSLALGSSRCLSGCSNSYLALLLAFAIAGVALVAFLFLCHLTVAEGMLGGLIFYANVIAVNQNVFIPSGNANILTVFIAWINLDFGIETCFFEGLDTYSSTWLQFAFPVYIWVLVGVVVYLSDISTAFSKIIGRTNPVAVLATLFLLSYTKLLQAIMVAFSFTTLSYPNGRDKLVWLYDGNLSYLDKDDSKHILLFLFSLLVFLLVFLPYTILLLTGQWIQKKSQLTAWLSTTKQLYLKAFLDAYYAPFTDKHRYWTGLLLLIRFFILLLTTIVNIDSPQDPFVSLVVLLVIVSGMRLWISLVVRRLYKIWYLDVLEASFTFNLIVLIGGTYQIRLSGGNQSALAYTSISIAFITFIGIIVSSVYRQVAKQISNKWKRAAPYQVTKKEENNIEEKIEEQSTIHSSSTRSSSVTCTIVQFDRQCSTDDSRDLRKISFPTEETTT